MHRHGDTKQGVCMVPRWLLNFALVWPNWPYATLRLSSEVPVFGLEIGNWKLQACDIKCTHACPIWRKNLRWVLYIASFCRALHHHVACCSADCLVSHLALRFCSEKYYECDYFQLHARLAHESCFEEDRITPLPIKMCSNPALISNWVRFMYPRILHTSFQVGRFLAKERKARFLTVWLNPTVKAHFLRELVNPTMKASFLTEWSNPTMKTHFLTAWLNPTVKAHFLREWLNPTMKATDIVNFVWEVSPEALRQSLHWTSCVLFLTVLVLF